MSTPIRTRIRRNTTPIGGWNIQAFIGGTWMLKAWTAGTREDARSTEKDVRERLQIASQP